MSPEILQGLLADLTYNHGIRTFHLKGPLTDECAEALKEMLHANRTMTSLRLFGTERSTTRLGAIVDGMAENGALIDVGFIDGDLDDASAQLVSKVIRRHNKLKKLMITGAKVGSSGAGHLASALSFTQTLTSLLLTNNLIGPEGAERLADALGRNRTLLTLGLNGNKIGDRGAIALTQALRLDRTLQRLLLNKNGITDAGTDLFAEVLPRNQALRELSLSKNGFGDKGVKGIAAALLAHAKLEKLFLDENNIGEEGVAKLCHALKTNKTLTFLSFKGNDSTHGRRLKKLNKIRVPPLSLDLGTSDGQASSSTSGSAKMCPHP